MAAGFDQENQMSKFYESFQVELLYTIHLSPMEESQVTASAGTDQDAPSPRVGGLSLYTPM